jgi:hypothetical protein
MKWLAVLVAFIVFLIVAAIASAMSVYTDRADFEAQGLIVHNYGFQEFDVNALTFPPNPHTQSGVTYVTGDNLVVGSNYDPYFPVSNVFCSNVLGPIHGDVQTNPSFNMLGMDLGYLVAPSVVDLAVSTNQGSYSYGDLIVPPAGRSLNFWGLVAGAGEYFTAFNVTAQDDGSAVVIDNVTLGEAFSSPAIPEPITLAGLVAGSATLAGYLRRRLGG